ncbi:response regulator [Microlunatus capsulatus]|uniref:DNA-binding NarL/FixJ family response regulator n=1 Tax=Microlunatus capsulatus TaxID=99117 RepID=A0ABS4ZCX8_9ACTN|nr:response regulator transcription factor [Microlunatus capsulatus]MBP2418864.1 DNA-binding NarL/FixJ family response regulator [Microlunatus capsulatus]
MISVFVVDDQELVRAGFAMVLDSQPDLQVVGQAGDGEDALAQLRGLPCDVVLMDVRMPRLDGVATTGRLLARPGPVPRVLMLTTFDLDEYAYRALRAGASGFLLKDCPPADLLAAVRSVALGETVLAPSTTRRLVERYGRTTTRDPDAVAVVASLSPREREILTAIARGRTNPEIAAELYLAEATVKTHVGRILARAGRRDRVALVILAYASGLVGGPAEDGA